MGLGDISEIRNYCADFTRYNLLPKLVDRPKYSAAKFLHSNLDFAQILLLGSFEITNSFPHFDLNSKNPLYFDSFASIASFIQDLNYSQSNLFVLHLALESAQNPLKLAGTLKDFLVNSPSSQVLYLFPSEFSPNCVYRQWSVDQVKGFFRILGLKTTEHQLGLMVSYDAKYEQQIARELFGFEFSPVEIKTVIVTKEYAPAHQTGGIGMFFYNRYLVNPSEVAVVYLQNTDQASALKIITPELFFTAEELAKVKEPDLALLIIRILTAFCSKLRFLHYHDYTGIGFRLAQACKTSELPARINTICSLNGNHQYVENASGVWSYFIDELEVAQEKIASELADIIIAPTKFIADLTISNGFAIADQRLQVLRHPFHFPEIVNEPRKEISRLVFFGKRIGMKGYPDFLHVAKKIVETNPKIKEIIFIGPESDICLEQLEELKSLVQVTEYSLSSRDAKNLLTFLAPDSLLLFPNPQENFGNVISEAISVEIPFVCYLSGGFTEVLLSQFHNDFGSAPNRQELLRQAEKLMLMDPLQLANKVVAMKSAYREMQAKVNLTWSQISNNLPTKVCPQIKFNSEDITLMIPIFETDFQYLEELFAALDLLVFKPAKIILVDDCSSDDYYQRLESFCNQKIRIPFQLVQTPKNLGCAGARNTALDLCQTKYLVNIDSDDIPYPNFLLSLYEAMEVNPQAVASLGFYSLIKIEDPLQVENIFDSFISYGDGIVANLRLNRLGAAMGIVKVDVIRELGGWTGNHKESGDDFRLYAKILCANLKIGIVPVSTASYRIRKNSHSHSVRTFTGDLLTAKELDNLPVFEKIRFQSVLQSAWNFQGEYEGAIRKIHNLYDLLDLKKQALERAEEQIRQLEFKSYSK